MTGEVLREATRLEEACKQVKRFLKDNPDARPRIALREMLPVLEAVVALGRVLGVINERMRLLDVFSRPMQNAPPDTMEVIFYSVDEKEFRRKSGFIVLTPAGTNIFDPLDAVDPSNREGRRVTIEDLVELGITPMVLVECLSQRATTIQAQAMVNMPTAWA